MQKHPREKQQRSRQEGMFSAHTITGQQEDITSTFWSCNIKARWVFCLFLIKNSCSFFSLLYWWSRSCFKSLMLDMRYCDHTVSVHVCDPPEKQSQLGSILQSQSEGAPEITDISPLVDTCHMLKMLHAMVSSSVREDDVKWQLLLRLISTGKEIMMVFGIIWAAQCKEWH